MRTPAPSTAPDTRTYRTELEQPSACGGRWGLYVDGRLIARSDGPLDHLAPQAWACAQLGEGVAWVNGRINPSQTWYWVANPAPHPPVITGASEQG